MSSLSEIANVVKASTISGVNVPQLVVDEARNVFVEQSDWQTFLTFQTSHRDPETSPSSSSSVSVKYFVYDN